MSEINYVAAVGKNDKIRLSIQHQTFLDGTDKFLQKIGIKPGMKILVVGCGAGDETVLIAKKVGSTGHVTAIDISPEQVEVCNERMSGESISNVTVRALDAINLDELSEQFDIVYCRMVLVHIIDPLLVLKKMLARVKSQGKLACEEPDISTCFTIPSSESFNKHIDLLCQFMRKNGCDPDLGSKTYKIFKDLGCNEVEINFHQPAVVDKEQKTAALLSAINCGPQYISSNLASKAEVDDMISGIEKEVVESDVVLGQCRMVQVSGTKA